MHTYSDDLKSADPQAVLDKLLQKSTVLAKKVALHQVKSVLEPKLTEQGLVWSPPHPLPP